jgi:hypothetical protein
VKISVLVPFGADESEDGKWRRQVWDYLRHQWEEFPTLELVVGTDRLHGTRQGFFHEEPHELRDWVKHPRPFSVSRALNNAAKHATGDAFLLFGADHVPDPLVLDFARDQLMRHRWVRLYDRIAYLSHSATHLLLNHSQVDAKEWHPISAPCDGVLAVRRAAWDQVGGMDEGYEGWGYEDTDLLHRLQRHVPGGRMEPSGHYLRELWHDGGKRNLDGPNAALFRERAR